MSALKKTDMPESDGTASAVSIVVVTYNATALLRRCLTAVANRGDEVIVVDNAPSSGDAELVRGEFPTVKLLEPGRNIGFAAAANAGAADARGRWILFLNPDAWPIADAVERLVDFSERNVGIGSAGPLLVDPEGHPQRSVFALPMGAARLAAWAALPHFVSGGYGVWRAARDHRRGESVRRAEFLMGAALLVLRAAFEQIGGFDESFFMFGEDADLCFRLREAGWRVDISPDASFVHVGGGSTSAEAARMYQELLRSLLRMIAKRKGLRGAERARYLLVRSLRLRGMILHEERDLAAATWLGARSVSELLADPR